MNPFLMRRRMFMTEKNDVCKLTKENGVVSSFNFGIRWCDVNKIVLVADNIHSIGNNIFFATYAAEWIGFNHIGNLTFNKLNGGKCNMSPSQIADGRKHEIRFTFNNTPSANAISNIWDSEWSKKISYYQILFYKDDILIANFVPDKANSDRMLDAVTGEYITASILGEYKLEVETKE